MDKNNIVNKAREYIGTPYHHEGRKKGLALDCIGLVICVGKDVGAVGNDFDMLNYSPNPDGITLMDVARKMLVNERSDASKIQIGDVIVVRVGGHRPQHVGIVGVNQYGAFTIIHANMRTKKTEEHRLVFGRAFEFVAAFEFKELSA